MNNLNQREESRQGSKIKFLSGKVNQNFGLKEKEFKDMLMQMNAGNHQLFEHVFLAHFGDCIKFLIKKYRVSHDLAYDATMETLITFRKRLLDGKVRYGNLRFLFTKMASQLLFKSNMKVDELDDEFKNNLEAPEEADESLFQLLDQSWNLLCGECSKLLKDFYYNKVPLKKLALLKGKSDAALRKEKQRCLEKLRRLFLKKLND